MTPLPRVAAFLSPVPLYLQEVGHEPITITIYGFGGTSGPQQPITVEEAEHLRDQLDEALRKIERHDPDAEPGRTQ